MYGVGHRLSTKKAFVIFHEVFNNVENVNPGIDPIIKYVAEECVNTDNLRDLEFIDVEGTLIGGGRDNPHEDERYVINDKAHYSLSGKNFTAFNHFIDIKKGTGIFDDYDGYSYEKGSASKGEYQNASDVTEIEDVETFFAEILGRITRWKVDGGLNWLLNDEYVHAPCHPWYNNCSPSIERYSLPGDKGIYSSEVNELKARFPLAASIGGENKGIPFSVFMPVDNLARFWYSLLLENNNMQNLGPVLHAIQDASIPHHTAGYMGNWHIEYEKDLNSNISEWLYDPNFKREVIALVEKWNKVDCSPPNILHKNDWKKVPAKNWRIDYLVTWVALNSYKEYARTYNHFKKGYTFNANSMRKLTKIAVAMSVLFLIKATEEAEGNILNYIGNKNTKEVHRPGCRYVALMNEENKIYFPTLAQALNEEEGYDRCYYCLRKTNILTGNILNYNYIGNRNTKELHKPSCHRVDQMNEENKVYFVNLEEALNEEEGYNGCYYCLGEYNTG